LTQIKAMEYQETIQDEKSRSGSLPENENPPLSSLNLAEASSNSPSLKTIPQDSTNVDIGTYTPSLSPSISSVIKLSTNPSLSLSSKETQQNSTNVDTNRNIPSFSPSILSINETDISGNSPSSSPQEGEDNFVNSLIPSSMPTSMQQLTTPSADLIDSPTTLRPTMLLEHPARPTQMQDEYEINLTVALVVIATPMLIISACFVWRWYQERKFVRSYRDFETSAFSHAAEHELS